MGQKPKAAAKTKGSQGQSGVLHLDFKPWVEPNKNTPAQLYRFNGKYGHLIKLPAESENSLHLWIGMGKVEELSGFRFKELFKKAFQQAADLNLGTINVPWVWEGFADLNLQARLLVEAWFESDYTFKCFLNSDTPPERKPIQINLWLQDQGSIRSVKQGIEEGLALGQGMNFMKDLANMPPNICTPAYMVEQALAFQNSHRRLKTQVFDKKALEKMGLHSLLAVGQGSVEPPYLVVVEYNCKPSSNQSPLILVGKGITYDTGGNSLKPASSMPNMKYDMSGSAAVLGLMKAAALMNSNRPIVGLLALAENMPGGSAIRPDDVIKSHAGLSIEVLNTDAEGRLVLCDALSYAQEKYKKGDNPLTIIDVATLTGACVVALGKVASGLFSNDEALVQAICKAGQNSGDRCWQLPLWEDYQESLSTNIADLANIGGPDAGSITAACFLARFIKDNNRWVHLDIAGTAYKAEGRNRWSTGRPIPLLFDYLLESDS